ncbi:hypothetical protein [Hymenobacter canadensis]|uniref:Uncharacterized protein n=1 Tax=Hymenobacter canadensis TaxID=2999067 RepID=A0ABY7LW65_9BACT|nr:hypothetical protein [Hymenobacter canadensis]WBA42975.1 hypothetical protein O3303_05275 [Hymenobacter canadensis]
MEKQSLPQLLPEVAEKYTATITPCVIEIQRLRRKIDLRRLTLAEADELVKDPLFPYLVARKARKSRPPAGKQKTGM